MLGEGAQIEILVLFAMNPTSSLCQAAGVVGVSHRWVHEVLILNKFHGYKI